MNSELIIAGAALIGMGILSYTRRHKFKVGDKLNRLAYPQFPKYGTFAYAYEVIDYNDTHYLLKDQDGFIKTIDKGELEYEYIRIDTKR